MRNAQDNREGKQKAQSVPAEPTIDTRKWQGQRVRLMVEAMGLSLMEFEKMLNRSRGWVNHIIAGKSAFGADDMVHLANEYGISIGRVFELDSKLPLVAERCNAAKLKMDEALLHYVKNADSASLLAVSAAMQELEGVLHIVSGDKK
ncbi:MAG: helix-turn-helix transcriptional regulator [Chlorobi bacterium]|nr:helix-turn-helix transcriptional regulator [Chlorobiota bacterium]